MCVKNFKSPYGEIIVEDDNKNVRLEIMYENYHKIYLESLWEIEI